MKQLVKIGYIAKPHKLSGAIKLILKEYAYSNISATPAFLFIEVNSTTLPFFIEKLAANNNSELIIKFEEIDDKESANNLKGATVLIDETEVTHKNFEKVKSIKNDLDLTGYNLFDEANNFIAKIEAVYFVPNNTLAAISINKEEVLLPLNEKLIVALDRNKKAVHLKIPDGLLNLNDDINEEE